MSQPVAELDGPGKWGIIKYSDLTKAVLKIGASSVTVTDGLVQFNDGSNNGLVKIGALVTKLNNLEDMLSRLISKLNAWTPVSVPGRSVIGR